MSIKVEGEDEKYEEPSTTPLKSAKNTNTRTKIPLTLNRNIASVSVDDTSTAGYTSSNFVPTTSKSTLKMPPRKPESTSEVKSKLRKVQMEKNKEAKAARELRKEVKVLKVEIKDKNKQLADREQAFMNTLVEKDATLAKAKIDATRTAAILDDAQMAYVEVKNENGMLKLKMPALDTYQAEAAKANRRFEDLKARYEGATEQIKRLQTELTKLQGFKRAVELLSSGDD